MLAVLVLTLCFLQTITAQCLTNHDAFGGSDRTAEEKLRRGQLDFSVKLLQAVVKGEDAADNVFISPLSIYSALLLAYFTASNHTEASIKKLLSIPEKMDKTNMMLAYKTQHKWPVNDEFKLQVSSANRLFISDQQTVRDCMQDLFEDEMVKVDFKDLTKTVGFINEWVKNETRGNIQNLLSADSLNPNSQLVLANAAFFKGKWKYIFDVKDTMEADFAVTPEKTVQVPMMFQQNEFGYYRSDQTEADAMEMTYEGEQISLILLLPDPGNDTHHHTTADVIARLTSDELKRIIRQTNDPKNIDKLEVKLPKFSTERTLELTSTLEQMGVGDLFKASADLTALSGGPKVRLTSAIHKAKVRMDEKGTEAAAATALTDTRIPANRFFCDRPFIYLLYDKTRDTLLYAGILNDPTIES